MANAPPRLALTSLAQRLRVTPVVLTGVRQTGKGTLAHELTPGNHCHLSLDDLDVMDLARRDPDALLDGQQHLMLDEVQRDPDLLNAVKRAVDRCREPGRKTLPCSANLLLIRQVPNHSPGEQVT